MTFKDYIENQLLNNEFVINLENFPGCISKWDFNYLLDFLKNNNHIGHVIHKKKSIGYLGINDKILKEIALQIIKNNRNFDAFTSDLILCSLAKLTFEYENPKEALNQNDIQNEVHSDDLEYFESKPEWLALSDDGWKVKRVFNFRNEKEINLNKYRENACIVYVNERRRQLVASFKGFRFIPEDFLGKESLDSAFFFSAFDSILVTTDVLKEIINLKRDLNFHLSFTGYSFGALLAEQCVLLYEFSNEMNDVKATTFDSPGSFILLKALNSIAGDKNQKDFEDLNIVTYMSSFNAVNTLNSHVGKIKLFYQDSIFPALNQNERNILDNLLNKEINHSIQGDEEKVSDCKDFESLTSKGLESILSDLQNQTLKTISVIESNKLLHGNASQKSSKQNLENISIYQYFKDSIKRLINSLEKHSYNPKKYEPKLKIEFRDKLNPHFYHNIDYYLEKLSKMKEFEGKSLDLLSKQMSLLKEIYKIETTVDLNDNHSMLEIVCPSKQNTIERIRSRLYRLIDIEKVLLESQAVRYPSSTILTNRPSTILVTQTMLSLNDSKEVEFISTMTKFKNIFINMITLTEPDLNDLDANKIEAEEVQDKILKYYNENGKNFSEDPTFTKEKAIAGLEQNIEYKRPNNDYFFSNKPLINDIKQGGLGTCWLTAAYAILVVRPELFGKIFIAKNKKSGIYTIRASINGTWVNIFIDDLLPFLANSNNLIFASCGKQFWVPIIEKALAKAYGSYKHLVGGDAFEGLEILTGKPWAQYLIDSSKLNETWAKLLEYYTNKYEMVCGCCFKFGLSKKDYQDIGLTAPHSYFIREVFELERNRLLLLINPHGIKSDFYIGDWSGYKGKWTNHFTDLRKTRLEKILSDNVLGKFYISFEDFAKYFAVLGVCLDDSKFNEQRMTGEFNYDNDKLHAFELIVEKKNLFFISIFQIVEDRVNYEIRDLSFFIVKKIGDSTQVHEMSGLKSDKSLCEAFTLDEGSYWIVPMSFNNLFTPKKYFAYNLVLHSDNEFNLKRLIVNLNFLSDCIQQYCLVKNVRKFQELLAPHGIGEIFIFDHKNEECSFFVAKNSSQSKYLNIQMSFKPAKVKLTATRFNPENRETETLEFEESSNFRTTRNLLQIEDSISPSSQKVIAVLTNHYIKGERRKNLEAGGWKIVREYQKWSVDCIKLEFYDLPTNRIQSIKNENFHCEKKF